MKETWIRKIEHGSRCVELGCHCRQIKWFMRLLWHIGLVPRSFLPTAMKKHISYRIFTEPKQTREFYRKIGTE